MPPQEIVKGAVEAVNESSKVKVYLVGMKEAVERELAGHTYPKEQIEVVPASEIIETAEPPVMAIRKKKDSSLVKALNLVKAQRTNASGAFAEAQKKASQQGYSVELVNPDLAKDYHTADNLLMDIGHRDQKLFETKDACGYLC